MPCPVCEWGTAQVHMVSARQLVDCPRCGKFEITIEAVNLVMSWEAPWRIRMACWVRHLRRSEDEEVRVTLDALMRARQDWRMRTVSEKLDDLLLALANASKFAGDAPYVFPQRDVVLGWGDDVLELEYQLDALKARGLVKPIGAEHWQITPAGWDRVAVLSSARPPVSNLVFVAMTFADALSTAWKDGLFPGITEASYIPERADTTQHNEKIDDRILAKIRAAQFVVADVTTQNRGAYFEAGFALGLNRQVIWSVREDDLPDVHFDTRQFNHIIWKTPDDLRTKIRDRILGVFGRGTAG